MWVGRTHMEARGAQWKRASLFTYHSSLIMRASVPQALLCRVYQKFPRSPPKIRKRSLHGNVRTWNPEKKKWYRQKGRSNKSHPV
jgi:hypothetical protein